MLSLLILTLLYFLPSVIGKDKHDAMGIFLVNLFLGWTLIGWVAAFLWAIAADRPAPVVYATAGGSRFCSHCGTRAVPLVQYCASCGARV